MRKQSQRALHSRNRLLEGLYDEGVSLWPRCKRLADVWGSRLSLKARQQVCKTKVNGRQQRMIGPGNDTCGGRG